MCALYRGAIMNCGNKEPGRQTPLHQEFAAGQTARLAKPKSHYARSFCRLTSHNISFKKQTTEIFISVINQHDAQYFCFTISLFQASTSFEHHVVIIRRLKLYYTASGVITPKIGVMTPEAV